MGPAVPPVTPPTAPRREPQLPPPLEPRRVNQDDLLFDMELDELDLPLNLTPEPNGAPQLLDTQSSSNLPSWQTSADALRDVPRTSTNQGGRAPRDFSASFEATEEQWQQLASPVRPMTCMITS